MDKCNLFGRNTLRHQFLLDVIVHIKGAIPTGRRQVAEHKLCAFLGFGILPDLQHIFNTGIDFAVWVIGQFRKGQPLIQSQLAPVRCDLEHIVLFGFHQPVAYILRTFSQFGNQFLLKFTGLCDHRDVFRFGNRQLQHLSSLDVRRLLPHGHEFREVKKLGKPGLGTESAAFRCQLQSRDRFAKRRRPAIKVV